MKKLSTKRMVLDALFAAMFLVLSMLSIPIGSTIKVTFESLPIQVGALMFGPVDGFLIAFVGTLIYQLTSPFGITPTIPLWMLPFMTMAVVVGSYAKKHHFRNTSSELRGIVAAGECICFLLNTLAIVVDSKLYGYYTPLTVWGGAGIRLVIMIGKILIYGFVIPPVLDAMAVIMGRKNKS